MKDFKVLLTKIRNLGYNVCDFNVNFDVHLTVNDVSAVYDQIELEKCINDMISYLEQYPADCYGYVHPSITTDIKGKFVTTTVNLYLYRLSW